MKKLELKKMSFMEWYFLVIIVMYAFDLGIIKYFATWIFIFLDVVFSVKKNNGIYNLGKDAKRYYEILGGITILIVITIVLQIKNGFNSYAINEILYFLTPILFIICYTKKMDNSQIERSINISFYVFVASFIYKFLPNLTLRNIMSISIIHSYSPFESELAFMFFAYECYYILKNDRKKMLALVFCILSFKRMCALFAIVVFIFSKYLTNEKKIMNRWIIIMTSIFSIVAVMTCLVISSDFIEQWVMNKYHISLNELTVDRSSRIKLVLDSDEIKYGLGSVSTYVTKTLNQIHGSKIGQRSLHNDIVQIYLECGIIGLILFLYLYLKAFSKNRMMFFLICYIFLECNLNHLFGAGDTQLWIVIYLILSYNNCSNRIIEANEGENKIEKNNSFYANI